LPLSVFCFVSRTAKKHSSTTQLIILSLASDVIKRKIRNFFQTSSGLISPARIGRLPDARTPGVSGLVAQKLHEEEEEEDEDDRDDDVTPEPPPPPPPPAPLPPVRQPFRPERVELLDIPQHELTPAEIRQQRKLRRLQALEEKQRVS